MKPERQVHRLRIVLLIAGACLLVIGLSWLWQSPPVLQWRLDVFNWRTAYYGCTCPECMVTFVGLPARPWSKLITLPIGSGEPLTLGTRTALLGVALLATSLFGKRALQLLPGCRAKRKGCCRQCGYDLKGLPHNGPCPECGLGT